MKYDAIRKKMNALAAVLLSAVLLGGCGQTAAETASGQSGAENASGSSGAETASGQSDTETVSEQPDTDAVSEQADYSLDSMWAYNGTDSASEADLFLIGPTTYGGDEENINMPLNDEEEKENFLGALNMERGIYEDTLDMYAPYYRQGSLSAIDCGRMEESYEIAYEDVSAAFEYYLENKKGDSPFVLAGFSQGAYMCLELMKNYPDELDDMIACYCIGWALTREDVEEYPQLVPAEGETDTGVIVCFSSEAEEITDSFFIPEGSWSYSINPLNWRTDGTVADKSLNKGACFTDYEGNITEEIPQLTGAYIDEERGALKVTDVTPEDYPAALTFLQDGEYHIYDYQFFYRNLQENVEKRVEAYLG